MCVIVLGVHVHRLVETAVLLQLWRGIYWRLTVQLMEVLSVRYGAICSMPCVVFVCAVLHNVSLKIKL